VAPEPRPDDAQIVALVEGQRFPVALVVVIAIGLAATGIGILVAPGVVQERRKQA
jgi:hypothetical protein